MILEVCVDSLESARAAIRGGAHRLELCAALALGGLTPYAELLRQIRQESDIPLRCLMRPRAGDFLYTPEEIQMMARQISLLGDLGADGFVIGCLNARGDLDERAMDPLIEAAQGKALTLHRAIDVSRDPIQTYLTAGKLGIDTVLTSGARATAMEGREIIGKLLDLQEQGGPTVLIGSGVHAPVIRALWQEFTHARAFHMSGKEYRESAMEFRREAVPMGAAGIDPWKIPVTSEDAVRQAVAALH